MFKEVTEKQTDERAKTDERATAATYTKLCKA